MLAVQMRGGLAGDEELTAVGVGAGVGHRQLPSGGVLHTEVFIGELLAVD